MSSPISWAIYETLFQDLCGDEKKAMAEKHPTTKFVLKNSQILK